MSDFLEPISRNEAILQNMLGAENELEEPQSRIETLLLALLEEWQNMSGGATFIDADIDIQTGTISNATMSVDEAISIKNDAYLVFRCKIFEGETDTGNHMFVPIGGDGEDLIMFETVTMISGSPNFVHINGVSSWNATITQIGGNS